METIFVRGGGALSGAVPIGGSKNAGLALMAACLLVDGKTVLRGMPDIGDIDAMAEILRLVGASVRRVAPGDLEIDAATFRHTTVPADRMQDLRASFYVLGPMLARLGRGVVAQPGGCQIGARPIDFHVRGLEVLGADISVEGGIVDARAERLHGARIYLDFPSAGATSHLMIAGALAEGVTVIENAATEPEIPDLAGLLRCLGARVEGAGSTRILVEGVRQLRSGVEYTVIPDRIEAGTYALAAAITRGNVRLENVIADHLEPVLVKLEQMGVTIEPEGPPNVPGALWVVGPDRCRPVDVIALPYPGFPSDMQQPLAAVLAVSAGTSFVTDRVFENRFRYVEELRRMGADIGAEGSSAFIHGVEKLRGASVTAPDLRGGAALIVAALAADGETAITGVEHLDRGYEHLVTKLANLGADITRVNSQPGAK